MYYKKMRSAKESSHAKLDVIELSNTLRTCSATLVEKKIYNHTGHAIRVIDRRGVQRTIPNASVETLAYKDALTEPTTLMWSLTFADVYTYTVDNARADIALMETETEECSESSYEYGYKEVFLRTLTKHYNLAMASHSNTIHFTVGIRLPLSQLVVNDLTITTNKIKTLYVPTEDVLVAPLDDEHYIHPFSTSTRISSTVVKTLQSMHGQFIGIDYINNSDAAGDRYIQLFGTVFQISPRKDILLDDGVRVTFYTPKIDRETKKIMVDHEGCPVCEEAIKHYSLEDRESIGLMLSQEEAMTSGDMKSTMRKELLKLEHDYALFKSKSEMEITQLKHSHALETSEADKRKLELQKQVIDLKAELEHLKYAQVVKTIERDEVASERKEVHEETKFRRENEASEKEHRQNIKEIDRSETREVVKTVAIVITAAVTILSVLAKVFFSKPAKESKEVITSVIATGVDYLARGVSYLFGYRFGF